MKNVLLLFTGIILAGLVRAQQSRFITIDAEAMQPFSVVLGKKNFSSSGAGHLVLANLSDSVLLIQVNFPQQKFKEHQFRIESGSRDRGFQLKKTGTLSWALYDWQTMELIQPVVEKANTLDIPPGTSLRTDGFARMMAAVVNDSAILVNTVSRNAIARKSATSSSVMVSETKAPPTPPLRTDSAAVAKNSTPVPVPSVLIAKEDPKPEKNVTDSMQSVAAKPVIAERTPPQKSDSIVPPAVNSVVDGAGTDKRPDSVMVVSKKLSDSVIVVEVKTVSPTVQPEPQKSVPGKPEVLQSVSVIRKMFDNTGKEWRDIRYRDSSATGVDTISIKILLETESVQKHTVEAEPEKSHLVTMEKTVAMDSIIAAPAVKEPEKTVLPKTDSVQTEPAKLVMVNSDCRATATDNDLDKLRVKMLAETGVEERISIARKAFRAKCYYTRQIKALSELFFTDESRYQFLDAAYPFIVDTDNFKSMVSLLTDTYYINRFKAMVRML